MTTDGAARRQPPGMTRRRAETQRRLVDAAYELFSELGIRDTPVELICERAGFTRGAFYSNFNSKEDLFLAVYQQQMGVRVERLRVAVDAAAESIDTEDPESFTRVLQCAGILFMESLAADRTWYMLNAEFRAQAVRQPELRGPTAAAQARHHDALASILHDLLGKLGMRLTVEPRGAVVVIVSLYETMLERALMDGLPSAADTRYVTDVLPRVLSSLITRQEAAPGVS